MENRYGYYRAGEIPIYSYGRHSIEIYELEDGGFLMFMKSTGAPCTGYYDDGIAWLSQHYWYCARYERKRAMFPSLDKFAHEHFTEAEWTLAALSVL